MFEVVITLRADFSEHVVSRHQSEREAQEEACRIALLNHHKVVRAWIRVSRPAKTQSEQ